MLLTPWLRFSRLFEHTNIVLFALKAAFWVMSAFWDHAIRIPFGLEGVDSGYFGQLLWEVQRLDLP